LKSVLVLTGVAPSVSVGRLAAALVQIGRLSRPYRNIVQPFA
jgi:hypothetical protein